MNYRWIVFIFAIVSSHSRGSDEAFWDAMEEIEAPEFFAPSLAPFETSMAEFLRDDAQIEIETDGLVLGTSESTVRSIDGKDIPSCAIIHQRRNAARHHVRQMLQHSKQLRSQRDLTSVLGRCLADWHWKHIQKHRQEALELFPKTLANLDRVVTYRWTLNRLRPNQSYTFAIIQFVSSWEGQFTEAQWLDRKGHWPSFNPALQSLEWSLELSPSRFCGKGIVGHFEGELHWQNSTGQSELSRFSAFAAGLD